MATLFQPFYVAIDGNGLAMAGAQLFFYQTGTTNPQNTYTTSALSTPNTNPVVADSNGLFPPIYLSPTGIDYKAILENSDGAVIATRDPLLVAQANSASTATLASASNVAIGAASADYIFITGSVTIASFDPAAAGTERTLEFAAALTLTNSTAIILPGGANIVTAAGDVAIFRSEGAGNWRCVNYMRASVVPPVSPSPLTATLGVDVALSNTGTYFDGPTLNIGTVGTWLVIAEVSLVDTAGGAQFSAKLWDGTTIIAWLPGSTSGANGQTSITLAGFITNPVANVKVSVNDSSSTSGKILFNATGSSKDSKISAFRIL